MEKIQKYSDIYTEQFMDFFADKKNLVSDIELQPDEYSIDVDKIIAELGITVEDTFFDTHSGKYDADKKIMYINTLESPQRQRFTKSHELGHFVFNH
ncbi:ImmA/IrrE family metallo-endopeptidase, partial [Streptococcus danieliae]|nr:ImmA/IrrE family metallo-endopeptidase [Streptococcus danieliae]